MLTQLAAKKQLCDAYSAAPTHLLRLIVSMQNQNQNRVPSPTII